MLRLCTTTFALTFLMVACSNKDTNKGNSSSVEANPTASSGAPAMSRDNPLFDEWNTPFGVPPFDNIDSSHYLQALRAGMAQHKREIDAIVGNAEPPDFANTIEALERSGRALSRVSRTFSAVNSANSDETTKDTARTIAPELSAHRDDISLNIQLFERVDAVYQMRNSLSLTPEQHRLLEEIHKDFVRSGVGLDAPSQARLREINAELATLAESFRENLLNDTNRFELLVVDRADLGQLPSSLVALAADEAKRRDHDCECWAFTLQRPSVDPFLQYSPNRELRRRIFEAYADLGNNGDANDNNAAASRMAQLRAERAALMGYKTHAHYVLSDRMAESPELVYELLGRVWKPAANAAKAERDIRQEMMRKDGVEGELQAWDWRYYTEKVRQANYDYDEEALRPYFEVTAVRDGVFALANRLFGLTFERRQDIPVWHPDQQAFEVREADGTHLAVLYMDFFARESKRGGGWMNALRQQSRDDSGRRIAPIVTNNFNFPAPTAEGPSLLSLDEAETLFHEFGHALHGMLSDVTYESLAGTSTPRDFVEFPSQVMENWMKEPEVLALFARHYRSGEAIPDEIVEKITASAKFDQGFKTVEYLAASYLDMAYHSLDSPEGVQPGSFEHAAMADIGLIREIIPRYRSTYFAHIFAGGYSAGYYSYLWSEVLDADAFLAFKETSLFDAETAARYRQHILSKGGTRPGMELFDNFRGRPPRIEPLLERRGFL